MVTGQVAARDWGSVFADAVLNAVPGMQTLLEVLKTQALRKGAANQENLTGRSALDGSLQGQRYTAAGQADPFLGHRRGGDIARRNADEEARLLADRAANQAEFYEGIAKEIGPGGRFLTLSDQAAARVASNMELMDEKTRMTANHVGELGSTFDGLVVPMENYGNQWATLTTTMQKAVTGQSLILGSWQEAVGRGVDGVVGIFAGAPELIDISLEEIMFNLSKQAGAVMAWHDSISALETAGGEDGLLDNVIAGLALAGPEAAGVAFRLVQDLPKAFEMDEILGDINTFEKAATSSVASMAAGMTPAWKAAFGPLGMSLWDAVLAGWDAGMAGTPLTLAGLPTFGGSGDPNQNRNGDVYLDAEKVGQILNDQNARDGYFVGQGR